MRRTETAARLLGDVLWHDRRPILSTDAAAEVMDLAVRNNVELRLARAYPDRFEDTLAQGSAQVAAFRLNLEVAAQRLNDAGVSPILIKADTEGDYTYSNFDLVLGDDGWDRALVALHGWAVTTSSHPLERTKLLLHPAHGPAAHLHRSVAWFDVPVMPTAELRARAVRGPGPWLVPDPADRLRIYVAHAVFQNMAIDLSELLELRGAPAATLETARRRSASDGWGPAFDVAWSAAEQSMARLNAGEGVSLPTPLPVVGSLVAGWRHAFSLARRRERLLALRAFALRVPLVAAKRRRLTRP